MRESNLKVFTQPRNPNVLLMPCVTLRCAVRIVDAFGHFETN